MTVHEVSNSDDFKKYTSTGSAVVDFSADWCGPCKRIVPIYKEMARKNKSISFLHVDIDEASDSMPNEIQDIDSVPTFYFYKDGKKIDEVLGADLNSIKAKIEKLAEETKKNETDNDNEDDVEDDEEGEKKAASSSEEGSKRNSAGTSSSDNSSGDEKKDKAIPGKKEVLTIHKASLYDSITSKGKAVVDFGAEWCGPCKKIAPIYDILADHFDNITFIRVDIDEAGEDFKHILNNVRSVPTFLFYHDGKIFSQFSGANPHKLRDTCEELAAAGAKTAVEEVKNVTEKAKEAADVEKTKEAAEVVKAKEAAEVERKKSVAEEANKEALKESKVELKEGIKDVLESNKEEVKEDSKKDDASTKIKSDVSSENESEVDKK